MPTGDHLKRYDRPTVML